MGNTESQGPKASMIIATGRRDWKNFSFQNYSDTVRLLWVYSAQFHHLPKNIVREIGGFLSAPISKLVRVIGTELQWFDVCTRQWSGPKLFNRKLDFFDHSSCLAIDSSRVFVCGGEEYCGEGADYSNLKRSAYILTDPGDANSSSGQAVCDVEELPNMLTGHGSPGLLHDSGHTYVFGGNANAGQSTC